MKDNRLNEMKNDYENIRIPEQLRQMVEDSIRQGKTDGEKEREQMQKEKRRVFVKRAAGGAVAAVAAITVMANSGVSIAHAMYQVPVLGKVAEIVTFREYESAVNDMELQMEIPEVSVKNEDSTEDVESTTKFNENIAEYTDGIIRQFEEDVKEAGGENKQAVNTNYTVITDNERLYSLRFEQEIIMASGSQSVQIYHLDKQTGKMINLAGIFKENVNFITPISENIKEQMAEQMELDDSIAYWLNDEMEEMNFQEITEETSFYVNENGMLVIVFDEYEVAPGYMGIVEFEIPMEVVQDLVQEGFLSLAA